MIVFELPGLPKTTNSGGRAHWAAMAREARFWTRCVFFAVRPYKPRTPFSKAELCLTRFSATEPDFDGLVSSFKHVIDGLIGAGVIANDKPSAIGQPQYHWAHAPRGKGKIQVKVREIT